MKFDYFKKFIAKNNIIIGSVIFPFFVIFLVYFLSGLTYDSSFISSNYGRNSGSVGNLITGTFWLFLSLIQIARIYFRRSPSQVTKLKKELKDAYLISLDKSIFNPDTKGVKHGGKKSDRL